MSTKTENKICVNCKQNFTIKEGDFNFYEKIKVPAPTWCPPCRLKRRFSHRNERTLYKRQCDLCKENILSIYSPKGIYKTYCPKCWYSDKWNPFEYGRDFDRTRPFLEQFIELDKSIPHLALFQKNSVDSPWVNYETDDKNCYLNVGGHFNQDCAYNQYALKSRDCLDNFWMMHGEFSYENILCENAYKNTGSIFCFECQDIWFSFDCRNCSNIIGCSGLRNKKYCIFNKQVTKEEYADFISQNINGSRDSFNSLRDISKKAWKDNFQRASFIDRSVNCTGNLIKDSKNCHDVWNVEKSENSSHSLLCLDLKDSHDCFSVWESELCHEVMAGMNLSQVYFSTHIFGPSSNIYYCNLFFGSNNCFGCSNFNNSEYTILNKKYSKEDYEKLKAEIIKHMDDMPFVDKAGRVYKYGEFLPFEASSFSYEESVANEYFPMSKDDMKKEGVNILDHQVENVYDVEVVESPDSIKEVSDDILNKAIKCQETGKLFKLIDMELAFYRRFNLPLPTKSPFARHYNRLKFISGHLELLDRNCAKCGDKVKSVYREDEFPTIYCEKCYQQEVY